MTRSLLTVTLLSRTYAARYLFFSLDATFAISCVLMGAYQCAIESQRDHSRTFARLSVGRCGWARLRLGRFRRTRNWHVRGERRIRTEPATLFGSCYISRCGRHLPTTAEMIRLKLFQKPDSVQSDPHPLRISRLHARMYDASSAPR